MGKHRVARATRAKTVVAGALTSGTLIAGGIGHAPQAEATCLSISGVDFGSGCKSAPLSMAIGLGPHASARAVKPWTVAFGTTVKPSVSPPWGGDPLKAVDDALVHAVRTLMPWLGAGSRRADAHRAAADATTKNKADEEAAAIKHEADQDAAAVRKIADEDAAAVRKKADEDATAIKHKADVDAAAAAKSVTDAAAIKQKADDDAAAIRKKADDDAAAIKQKADADAAAVKKKADDDAAAAAKSVTGAAAIKQKADEDAAAIRKKADEDAATVKTKADQDAAAIRKKADEDAAAVRKKADDDAAVKNNSDDESLVKTEARLRELNDAASREYNLSEKKKAAAQVERDALAPNDPHRAEKEIAFDKADVAVKRALRKYSESGRLLYAAQQKYEAFRKVLDADDSDTVTEVDVAARKAALDEAKNALSTIQTQRNREFSEFEAAVQELEALGGNDPRRAEARAKVLKTYQAEINSRESYATADLAAFTAQTEYDATKKAAEAEKKRSAGNASGPQAASRAPEGRSERVVHAEEPGSVSPTSGMEVDPDPDPDAPSPTDEHSDSADSGSTNELLAPKEHSAKSTVTADTPERDATETSEIVKPNGSHVDTGDRAVSDRADASGRSVENVPSTEAAHPKTSPSLANTPRAHADGTGDTGSQDDSNTVSGSAPQAKPTSDAGASTDSPPVPKS